MELLQEWNEYGLYQTRFNMENLDNVEVDPQVKKDFENLMKDCPQLTLNSKWEMSGEYFKKFSIYEDSYDSNSTNCVN